MTAGGAAARPAAMPGQAAGACQVGHGPAEACALPGAAAIQLRRMPFPYRAMLAICSDLDETRDRELYWQTMQLLNTTRKTAIGQGLGLEVGNSIYFEMPSDQFAYWNTDEVGREMVRSLIRAGFVDCLHSYGDHATTRARAGRALDELVSHDCRLEVWVDHGVAPTNFGPDIMQGHGDEPGHEAYHADLTIGYGIQYVWRGRVTSVTGQGVPSSLEGLWMPRHPLASTRTLAKEALKAALGGAGYPKYEMHPGNRVLRRSRLRDGSPVHEFLRSNPHWGGVSSCETGRGIGRVLTAAMLSRLVRREGFCILYTHLGKVWSQGAPFDEEGLAGFQRLAAAQQNGGILVTTTRRLLGFCRALEEATWSAEREGDLWRIQITMPAGGAGLSVCDLDGLTFYAGNPGAVRLSVNGKEVSNLRINGPDHTGRSSVSLPWTRLRFPDL